MVDYAIEPYVFKAPKPKEEKRDMFIPDSIEDFSITIDEIFSPLKPLEKRMKAQRIQSQESIKKIERLKKIS